MNIPKIVFLQSRLSGYMASCWRALRSQYNAEITAWVWPAHPNAPFQPAMFGDLGDVYDRRTATAAGLVEAVYSIEPTAVVATGWVDSLYLKVCREVKEDFPVIAMVDTQWTGSPRQLVAAFASRWYLKSAFDVLWVAGERQRVFAAKLGYRGRDCWEGCYSCDQDAFRTARHNAKTTDRRRSFIFVGRCVPEKGIATLVDAYAKYRDRVRDPWPLTVAGSGPLQREFDRIGAEHLGFVQPNDLPGLLAKEGVFVLPSRFEPWGVALHEATAAGMPVVASDACGAGVHLVRDRVNGRVFCTGDAEQLCECFLWCHSLTDEQLAQAGDASARIAMQYSPAIWSTTLVEGTRDLIRYRDNSGR